MTDKHIDELQFQGFEDPQENWSKLPHAFVEALPYIGSLGELKCILYVLRHTWGYQEYRQNKRITTDEFMHGRKKRDGSRMDKGTGLSKPAVIDGLARAVAHCFLVVEVDDSDGARIEKAYALNMSAVNNTDTGVNNVYSGGKDSLQRTEKDTNSNKLLEIKIQEGANAPRVDTSTGEVLPSKKDKPAAVVVFKEVMHFWPHKSLHDLIAAAVGEDGLQLQRWRDVLVQWLSKGYSPRNVEGVLDVWAHGWKKHDGKPKAAKPSKPDYLGGKFGNEIQH